MLGVGDKSFKSAQFCLIPKGKHELFTRVVERNLTFLCLMTWVLTVGPKKIFPGKTFIYLYPPEIAPIP